MEPDPIVDEVHRIRTQIAERFGNDLRAIFEDARRRQLESGVATVSVVPRPDDLKIDSPAEPSKKVG
jgi:hypothetical protein